MVEIFKKVTDTGKTWLETLGVDEKEFDKLISDNDVEVGNILANSIMNAIKVGDIEATIISKADIVLFAQSKAPNEKLFFVYALYLLGRVDRFLKSDAVSTVVDLLMDLNKAGEKNKEAGDESK